MTLQEILRGLDQFGPGLTIYAEVPWEASGKAIVARPREDGGIPDEAVTAHCTYFLEVHIARALLLYFRAAPGQHQEAGELEQCARLIEYAEWLVSENKPLSDIFTRPNYPYKMLIRCEECGKHFDIVVTSEGPQNYRCTACGKELVFDLEAFMKRAIEVTKKMGRASFGKRRAGI
jgi:hypothetical protein